MIVNVTRTGSAASASDFTAIAATAIISAGSSSAVVNVTPLGDSTNEGNETVILTVMIGTGYVVGSPGSATVNIADGRGRTPSSLSPTIQPPPETAGSPGQFTVTRTAPTTAALAVNLAGAATNTADYANVAATINIPASAASATINITPVDDGDTEGPEDVTISLASGTTYDIGAQSFDNVTIADNDNPPVVFIGGPPRKARSSPPLTAQLSGVRAMTAPAPVTQWSLVSGTGTANIKSPSATTTAVTFSAPGTYVLRVTATDGQFSVSDQVTVVAGSGLVGSKMITQDLGPSSSRRGQGLNRRSLHRQRHGSRLCEHQQRSGPRHGAQRRWRWQCHARLTSLPTTAALAGVTIRDSLARGSNRAVLGYVAWHGIAVPHTRRERE